MLLKRTGRLLGIALASLLVTASHAEAKDLAGVKMPDTLSVGGKSLVLNGLGLRKKAIFKVYVGGLYLESASKDAPGIVAADTAKAIRMQFLRSIGKDKLIEGFKEGFEGNAGDKLVTQKANMDKFLALTADVKDGDVWTFSYAPGKGTVISHGEKEVGMFEGKEFADALFSIWLGPKPPSDDLKKGMLG
ncbi:MAG: chalcone isomerase family protein [Thermoanaerobaculia bacterium]